MSSTGRYAAATASSAARGGDTSTYAGGAGYIALLEKQVEALSHALARGEQHSQTNEAAIADVSSKVIELAQLIKLTQEYSERQGLEAGAAVATLHTGFLDAASRLDAHDAAHAAAADATAGLRSELAEAKAANAELRNEMNRLAARLSALEGSHHALERSAAPMTAVTEVARTVTELDRRAEEGLARLERQAARATGLLEERLDATASRLTNEAAATAAALTAKVEEAAAAAAAATATAQGAAAAAAQAGDAAVAAEGAAIRCVDHAGHAATVAAAAEAATRQATDVAAAAGLRAAAAEAACRAAVAHFTDGVVAVAGSASSSGSSSSGGAAPSRRGSAAATVPAAPDSPLEATLRAAMGELLDGVAARLGAGVAAAANAAAAAGRDVAALRETVTRIDDRNSAGIAEVVEVCSARLRAEIDAVKGVVAAAADALNRRAAEAEAAVAGLSTRWGAWEAAFTLKQGETLEALQGGLRAREGALLEAAAAAAAEALASARAADAAAAAAARETDAARLTHTLADVEAAVTELLARMDALHARQSTLEAEVVGGSGESSASLVRAQPPASPAPPVPATLARLASPSTGLASPARGGSGASGLLERAADFTREHVAAELAAVNEAVAEVTARLEATIAAVAAQAGAEAARLAGGIADAALAADGAEAAAGAARREAAAAAAGVAEAGEALVALRRRVDSLETTLLNQTAAARAAAAVAAATAAPATPQRASTVARENSEGDATTQLNAAVAAAEAAARAAALLSTPQSPRHAPQQAATLPRPPSPLGLKQAALPPQQQQSVAVGGVWAAAAGSPPPVVSVSSPAPSAPPAPPVVALPSDWLQGWNPRIAPAAGGTAGAPSIGSRALSASPARASSVVPAAPLPEPVPAPVDTSDYAATQHAARIEALAPGAAIALAVGNLETAAASVSSDSSDVAAATSRQLLRFPVRPLGAPAVPSGTPAPAASAAATAVPQAEAAPVVAVAPAAAPVVAAVVPPPAPAPTPVPAPAPAPAPEQQVPALPLHTVAVASRQLPQPPTPAAPAPSKAAAAAAGQSVKAPAPSSSVKMAGRVSAEAHPVRASTAATATTPALATTAAAASSSSSSVVSGDTRRSLADTRAAKEAQIVAAYGRTGAAPAPRSPGASTRVSAATAKALHVSSPGRRLSVVPDSPSASGAQTKVLVSTQVQAGPGLAGAHNGDAHCSRETRRAAVPTTVSLGLGRRPAYLTAAAKEREARAGAAK